MKIALDPNALSFGDLEDFETATGEGLMETFGKVGEDGNLQGLKIKTMVALVWVCGRQENPDFTLDDARKVRLNDLEIDVVGEAADPTPGDG